MIVTVFLSFFVSIHFYWLSTVTVFLKFVLYRVTHTSSGLVCVICDPTASLIFPSCSWRTAVWLWISSGSGMCPTWHSVLNLRLKELPCDNPTVTAERKSERLNQSHTLTFKALAWTDGTLAHIPLLCTSHMAKPNITIARKYVHSHPRQDGSIIYHNHQHHFAVYIFSEFSICRVCAHICTFT